jgi:hypothetical protein
VLAAPKIQSAAELLVQGLMFKVLGTEKKET